MLFIKKVSISDKKCMHMFERAWLLCQVSVELNWNTWTKQHSYGESNLNCFIIHLTIHSSGPYISNYLYSTLTSMTGFERASNVYISLMIRFWLLRWDMLANQWCVGKWALPGACWCDIYAVWSVLQPQLWRQ